MKIKNKYKKERHLMKNLEQILLKNQNYERVTIMQNQQEKIVINKKMKEFNIEQLELKKINAHIKNLFDPMALAPNKIELKQKMMDLLQTQVKDLQLEILYFRQLILLDSNDINILSNLAQIYYKNGYFDNFLDLSNKIEEKLKEKGYENTNSLTFAALKFLLKAYSYKIDSTYSDIKKLRDNFLPNSNNEQDLINLLQMKFGHIIPQIRDNIKKKNENEQLKEIQDVKNLLARFEIPKKPDQKVYILSMNWFQKWKKYIKYNDNNDNPKKNMDFMDEENTYNEYYLNPIDQNDILDLKTGYLLDNLSTEQYTNIVIKYDTIENKDFIIISQDLWDYLYMRYNGMSIPRYTIWANDNQHNIQVEIWLQKINILPLSSEILNLKQDIQMNLFHSIYISKKKTIKDIYLKLQRIYTDLSINYNNYEKRLWKLDPRYDLKILSSSIIKNSAENNKINIRGKLLKDNVKIEDAEIGDADIIVLEYKYNNSWLFDNIMDIDELINDKKYGKMNESSGLAKKILKKSKSENEIFELIKNFEITTRDYSPYSRKGLTGLQNLGNTCFMNSALQCLSNTYSLTEYFIKNQFIDDLNIKNPIGTGGKLAIVYAELLKDMWYGNDQYVSPWDLKKTIGRMASQFVGYGQQDSQELLSYLLDGLNEDLNRVLVKPIVETIESNNRDDELISSMSWENHLKRNKSKIQELMHGQYKSTLICPDCRKISITFDPYMMLSLPIPQIEYAKFFLYLISENPKKLPMKIIFSMPKNTSAKQIKAQLANILKVKENTIVMALLKENKIIEMISDNVDAYFIKGHVGIPFAYEIASYDQDKITNQNEGACLVKALVSQESKSFYDSDKIISYTRLLFVETQMTFEDFHIKVYEKMRHHMLNYYTKLGRKNININLEDKSLSNLKNEYKELFAEDNEQHWLYKLYIINSSKEDIKTGKKPICSICDKRCKTCVIPYESKKIMEYSAKMNISISEIVLDIKFNKNVKLEYLNLNTCEELNTMDNENRNKEYNIYDCLKLFTNTEKLEKDNTWYCPNCKEHKEATKKMEIYNAPEILIIHLKRFKTSKVNSFGSYYFASGSQKLSVFIDFPLLNLDLSEYILNKNSKISKIYDLYAVSNHYGALSGGHYTAYCKNHFEERWFEFDDSRVSTMNEKGVVSNAAYVLFYKRRK